MPDLENARVERLQESAALQARIAHSNDQVLEFLRFLHGYGIFFESTLREASMMLPVSVYAQ